MTTEEFRKLIEKIQKEVKIKESDTIAYEMYFKRAEEYLELLDLYQKEKEENKKLKELLQKKNRYTHDLEKDLFEGCSNYVVRKDEIREKIKELEQYQEQHKKGNWGDIPIEDYDFDKISLLKELLGE